MLQTAILGDLDNTQAERATALRMLIALLSENAEPPRNDQINGTSVSVLWQGQSTSLYDVWNRGMPSAIAGGDSLPSATGWAQYLIGHIKAGDIFPYKTSWLKNLSLCYPGYTSMGWVSRNFQADLLWSLLRHVCDTGPELFAILHMCRAEHLY